MSCDNNLFPVNGVCFLTLVSSETHLAKELNKRGANVTKIPNIVSLNIAVAHNFTPFAISRRKMTRKRDDSDLTLQV